jgi:hypothetical protein
MKAGKVIFGKRPYNRVGGHTFPRPRASANTDQERRGLCTNHFSYVSNDWGGNRVISDLEADRLGHIVEHKIRAGRKVELTIPTSVAGSNAIAPNANAVSCTDVTNTIANERGPSLIDW